MAAVVSLCVCCSLCLFFMSPTNPFFLLLFPFFYSATGSADGCYYLYIYLSLPHLAGTVVITYDMPSYLVHVQQQSAVFQVYMHVVLLVSRKSVALLFTYSSSSGGALY